MPQTSGFARRRVIMRASCTFSGLVTRSVPKASPEPTSQRRNSCIPSAAVRYRRRGRIDAPNHAVCSRARDSGGAGSPRDDVLGDAITGDTGGAGSGRAAGCIVVGIMDGAFGPARAPHHSPAPPSARRPGRECHPADRTRPGRARSRRTSGSTSFVRQGGRLPGGRAPDGAQDAARDTAGHGTLRARDLLGADAHRARPLRLSGPRRRGRSST